MTQNTFYQYQFSPNIKLLQDYFQSNLQDLFVVKFCEFVRRIFEKDGEIIQLHIATSKFLQPKVCETLHGTSNSNRGSNEKTDNQMLGCSICLD